MEREQLEEKIQDLIDGRLSAEEAKTIEQELQKDEYLKVFYGTMKEVNQSLHLLELMHPSDKFTGDVMLKLHRPKASLLDYKSLLIFIGLVICAAVGLIYSSQVSLSIPEITSLQTEVNIPVVNELTERLPVIGLPSAELLLNIFYFGLLFMALIYFDKVILKQLFKRNGYSA